MLDHNKLAIALAVRAAMQEHRKGKPLVFSNPTRPPPIETARAIG